MNDILNALFSEIYMKQQNRIVLVLSSVMLFLAPVGLFSLGFKKIPQNQRTKFVAKRSPSRTNAAMVSKESYTAETLSFLHGRPSDLKVHHQMLMAQKETSYALVGNELASIALIEGNEDLARSLFLDAYRVMNDVSSFAWQEKKAQGIFFREDVKVYKGDPYEKMMNSLYLSLLLYKKGDIDNALACLKNAILVDSASEDTIYNSDFAILYALAARMERLRKSVHKAQEYEDKGIEEYFKMKNRWQKMQMDQKFQQSPFPLVYSEKGFRRIAQETGSMLLICELGRGPVKYRTGRYGEEVKFAQVPRHIKRWSVLIDGEKVSSSRLSEGHNVFYQAVTRGGRKMDALLKQKVSFKEGFNVLSTSVFTVADKKKKKGKKDKERGLKILGYLLQAASALTCPEADVRHWSLLPDEWMVVSLDLEPGEHLLEIEAYDAKGKRMKDSSVIKEFHITGKRDVLFQRIVRA